MFVAPRAPTLLSLTCNRQRVISDAMRGLSIGLGLVLMLGVAHAQQPAPASAPVTSLNFEYFRTRVQPILLHKREGLARCYVCHSQGTPLVIQELSPGATTWNEEQSRLNYDAWLYFNHFRLFELARAYGVKLKQAFGYRDAKALNLVDGSGNLLPRPASSSWMYSGGEGMTMYRYVHSVFEAVLERIAVRNFSDFLDRGVAYGLLEAGDFVLVHGAHIFKIEEDRKAGPGQTMLGRRHNQIFWQDSCAASNSYYFDRHGDVPFRPSPSLETSWRSARFDLDDYRFERLA